MSPTASEEYHAAVAALTERGRFGIRLGLGRTRALLHAFDDPHLQLRGALVGGTNGKGSVLALAGSALRAAGIRTGTTPKPHLVSYRERMEIDGRPIDPVTFARLVREALSAAARVERRHGPPTEFELLTAMLFRWFAEERVEVGLIEVGLGGRLDATHAWDGGVAAITNVALDHMAWLGDTVPAIAREKAAIIMRGDQAVTGASGDALDVIRARARRVGAPLAVVEAPRLLGWDRDGLQVDLGRLGPTRISLRGRHQAENAAVADGVLDALATAGIADVSAEARRHGFGHASWPGRLELIRVGDRDVLLDGAHNPAGAAALASALDDLRPFLEDGADARPAPITLVHGSMADKDVDGVIRALDASPALAGARIVTTQVAGERALPAADLAARWRTIRPDASITAIGDVGGALDRAAQEARGPVVVAGSLYLVGAARRRWVDDPAVDDPQPWAGGSWRMSELGETRIGPRVFRWGERTFVMGILNVTPDSFSGDGLLAARDAVAAALAQALRMAEEGADLLDIGGESTRPGHASVDEAEELRRTIPVIRAVRDALPTMPLTIDTTKAAVAQAALDAGADAINDIWGVATDDPLVKLAASRGVPLILMHNRAEARYDDVMAEVIADLAAAVARAVRAGVPGGNLIVDPGIGFGKTAEQNLDVLRRLTELRSLGRPILLGASRKSTLGKVLDLPADQRLEATLATTALGIGAGVDIVRVHDVLENVRAARMADAIVRGSWREATG